MKTNRQEGSEEVNQRGIIPVLRPPKIYLDTNHVINIAKLRHGKSIRAELREAYGRIDELVRARHFGLVLNFNAAMEWVEDRQSIYAVRALAAVFDSARLLYLFDADVPIYTREVLLECRRLLPSLSIPDIPLLPVFGSSKSSLGALLEIPGYLESERLAPGEGPVTGSTVMAFVEAVFAWKQKNREVLRERVAGYRAAILDDMQSNLFSQDQHALFEAWMKRFLRIDIILSARNPDVDVDSLLRRIEMKRCPAVWLFATARTFVIRERQPPKDNDVDDWMFLPVVPYVDVVLTERRLRGFLLQADPSLERKVFFDPRDAAARLEAWC